MLNIGTSVETYDGPGIITAHSEAFGEPCYRVCLADGTYRDFDPSRVRAATVTATVVYNPQKMSKNWEVHLNGTFSRSFSSERQAIADANDINRRQEEARDLSQEDIERFLIGPDASVDPHTLPDTLESLRLAPEDVQHVERVNGGRRLLLTLKSGQVLKVYDVEHTSPTFVGFADED